MTRSPPKKLSRPTRSKRNRDRSMDNCTLKKDIARRNFKKLATATITDSRRRVVDILDFKKQHDQTLYLVQRDGDLEGSWETEASIEAQDMLSDYQKKVHDESGYSFQGESQGRLSRLSKARAVMAIKNTESALLFSNDENDSNDNFKSGTKRKVSSSNNRSHAKKGKSVGGRKTKAIITLETQKEERQARKVQREVLNVGLIMQEIEENDNSDCCLVCAAGSYKKCLKKDDIKGFKRALNDVDNVPAPSDNNSYDLGILGLSIVLGKMNFIKLIDEKKRELELKPTKRPEIPAKYMKQDFGTGSNYARGAYGGISFRQVQVSRGNRQGDSAFYDNLNTQSEDYKIQVDLDTQLSCENIQGFMSYISKPSFEELETIYSYKQHVNSSPIDVYYAAVAGNRKLVSHLIQTDFQGRSPFNSLHVETLAFIDGRPLGNYRKPQILKNAFEARGITPFHCAAINPSRIYLQEFYEVLDSSERLKVDNCGRTVIFFAAASETSDCLEYLISQGVSVTQMDKYRVTPLVQATRFGRLHNVDLIIKKLLEGKKDNEDSSIVFQSLIRNKRTVLHLAAFFGHIEICRILIRYGCPVEAVEALEKQTALMYAAKNGQFECVRILIEEGNANPEKGDKYAKNALHLACIGGHLEIVKYLLSQGLDANASDSSQNRPAHYAAAFGHLDILRLLIHYGQANPGLSSVWRTTPCSIANVKGHMAVVKYLLSLPGNLINVDFKNEEGRTMLQHTVTESASNVQDQELNLKKARLLISMNANVNVTDLNGDTCLHLIAKSTTFIGCLPRFYESFYPEKRRKERRCEYQSEKLSRTFDDDDQDGIVYYETFAKLLISHGADIHLKNQEGETPLASAMRSNNHSIVILLIQSGAKYWEDVDREGNNFIHYFTRFIAYVDQLQPHRDIDQVQKDRFLAYADAVFNSIETEQPVNDGLKLLANTANNEGYPPIVYGVYQAIRLQKKAVAREKSMIRDVLGYPYQYSTEYKQKYNLEAEEARNYEIDLTLSFNLWIKYMDLALPKFGCNINGIVALPKDFKTKNLNAKKSDYPKLTGYGAIHFAAQTQCSDLVHFLLKHGCDPNLRVNVGGIRGDTSMTIAYHQKHDGFQEIPDDCDELEITEEMKKRFTLKKPDFPTMLHKTIQYLVRYQGCSYLVDASGYSPIMKAASNMDVDNLKEMCKAVPLNEANINTLNELGQTALTIVVDKISELIKKKEKPDIEIVKHLLLANADPNVQDEDKNTIFMKAIKTSHETLVEIILENTQVKIQNHLKNKCSENTMNLVCSLNQEFIVEKYLASLKNIEDLNTLVLNTCGTTGSSPLSLAAGHGNLKVTRVLLSLGADPNFCNMGVFPLAQAVRSKNIEVVKALLDAGADVSCKTSKGNTALHIAVFTEKHHVVKLLLEYGADANAVNNNQNTPMHFAIEVTKKQQNRSFRVERLLIQSGASLRAKDNFGRTPLHYAFVKMDFVPLNRHTAIVAKKLQQITKELNSDKMIEDALLSFSNTYSLDPSVTTDAWLEASKRKQLKQKDEKEKSKNVSEEHIVMTDEEKKFIKGYNQFSFEKESDKHKRFDPMDIVKYLTDHEEIDCDSQDEFGRTPLHYAACVGAFSCTTILIGKKVNINAVDADHNGPLQLALQNGHVDYAVMLCNTGASSKNQVTMKNGKEASTFGYSLSLSVINLAYLIMERGTNLIESVHDSLVNGKFHMAELLIKSAQNEALLDVLKDRNQNLWHIISNFTPFDSEIWNEYFDEIATRIAPLNLGVFPDKFMRTPLHYAAKHGQTTLLSYLLPLGTINLFDEDGKSELYYAVESGNVESVQTLIRAGAHISGQKESKDESMLLKAVKANRLEIVRLLLENGINTDEDSQQGRSNAVMAACQNENSQILELLINSKANLDTPSAVERKDNSGKKIMVITHPIFVASSKADDSIFKALIAANANLNVYGPNCYPENGRSLFMFNVCLDKTDNQKALLEKKIDLDMLDGPDNQSIFYQFLFFQLGVFKNNKTKDKNEISPKFKDSIFNQMIKEFKPQVSHVDKASGMTPLELAISKNSSFITERLLALNADPNVESCYLDLKPGFTSFVKTSHIKIPAILHAVLQNNLKIFTIICQQTKVPINWLWQDGKRQNILSYAFGCTNDYSTENTFMLEQLKDAMGDNLFREALYMIDSQDNTPVAYAFQRSNKFLYDCLTRLVPSVKTINLEEAQNNGVDDGLMEVDVISMSQIDEDAQTEREILQKEQDAKKKKDSTNDDVDTKAKVDPYSKLQKVGHIEYDEDDKPYDIMLLKIEIHSWNGTESSFYKMSIIRNRVLDLYVLWTRWGPFGDEGQHQTTPYLTKEEAVSEFKSIFRSKTGNVWEERSSSFIAKPEKYEILNESHHPKDTLLKDFDFMVSSTPSNLPDGVFNVMKLICNYQYLSRVYTDTYIDMPLGQVSQKRIDQAYKTLLEARELNDKYYTAKKKYSDREQAHMAKLYGFELMQKCFEYSRLMPHNNQSNKIVRSLLHDKYRNYYKLSSYEEELANLLDLTYVGFAANVILAAKHRMNEISPLDYAYRALNCTLRELDGKETEYSMIKSYMASTSEGHELVNVFAVQRDEERTRFSPFENSPNRRLLWHGSRIGNFMGILKQGLRGAPNTTTNNGALLGTGVYFADNFTKSLNYCQDHYISTCSPYMIMLLCEVALGEVQICKDTGDIDSTQYDSVQALGETIPNPFHTIFDKRGMRLTFGPCVKNNDPEFEEGYLRFNHNEYMVHNENRVKIRYLLVVKNTSICALCLHSKGNDNIKPFKNHELSDYKFDHFNDYEKEIVKAYITNQQQNIKEIFDSNIESYISNGEYKKKWDVPLDVTLESKVCTSCSEYVLSMILEDIMTSNDCSVDIPDSISQRPQCHYGRECRTQHKIFHAKKYQHWLKDKKKTEDTNQSTNDSNTSENLMEIDE